MKNINWKKIIPHFIAIAIFWILTAAYFSPIFEGYELKQGDVVNYKGMAKEITEYRKQFGKDPLWTNAMFGGMPAYQIDIKNDTPIRYIDKILMMGFSGVIGYFFLLFVGFYILILSLKINPWLGIAGAIAFAFSTYFITIIEAGHNTKVHAIAYMPAVLGGFILTLRGNKWCGAAIFSLSLALQIMSNHPQITYYMFMLFMFLIAGEIIFYFIPNQSFIMQSEEKNKVKSILTRLALLFTGATLAVLCNSLSLWSTYEYGKDTTRGESELSITVDGTVKQTEKGLDAEYITNWSYGKDETFTFLIPGAKGGASGSLKQTFPDAISQIENNTFRQILTANDFNAYWGDQPFTSGPFYMGSIIVFLFVLSFVFVKDKIKWPVLLAALVVILLSWGKNYMDFTQFFLDNFPMYNKFRAVTMILVVVSLLMPFMAVLFLNQLEEEKSNNKFSKKFFIATAVFAGFMLLLIAAPRSFISFISKQEMEMLSPQTADMQQLGFYEEIKKGLQDLRISVFRQDALRSLGFILVAAALIYVYLRGLIKSKVVLYISLAVLITIDLWVVDKRFLNNEESNNGYAAWQKKGTAAYSAAKADYEILTMEASANPELGKQIQEKTLLITNPGEKPSQEQIDDAVFYTLNFNTNYRVLELGNPFNSSRTSYFHKSIGGYHGAKLKRYQEIIEFYISKEHQFIIDKLQSGITPEKLDSVLANIPILNMLNTKYIIYNPNAAPLVNKNAYGNAWFINTIKWVNNANEEILEIGKNNLQQTAVANKRFEQIANKSEYTKDSSAAVTLISYLPNHLVYESNNTQDGFAVFSEIYYNKGWKAYIDNNPAEYINVNYILRGLPIPAGKHTIEFKFEPENYAKAKNITWASNIVLIIMVVSLSWAGITSKRKKDV